MKNEKGQYKLESTILNMIKQTRFFLGIIIMNMKVMIDLYKNTGSTTTEGKKSKVSLFRLIYCNIFQGEIKFFIPMKLTE